MKSGFVSFVGRPNAGKSTLLNAILGQKVSIVSDKPQTTRHQVRGVLNRTDAQLVFVDTPGIHKAVTPLGERLNTSATEAIAGVDVVCLVIDATKPIGRGDLFVADRIPRDAVVVLNKIDIASKDVVLEQLVKAGQLEREAYFPVSAITGKGVSELVEHLVERLPEGPLYYPQSTISDMTEATWVAELVREQLFAVMQEEMPYSITTVVTDWDEGPRGARVRCEILVERESQKGMVIGRQGAVLKAVGTAVREQLPSGTHLELFVKVEKDWQRRSGSLDRLGY